MFLCPYIYHVSPNFSTSSTFPPFSPISASRCFRRIFALLLNSSHSPPLSPLTFSFILLNVALPVHSSPFPPPPPSRPISADCLPLFLIGRRHFISFHSIRLHFISRCSFSTSLLTRSIFDPAQVFSMSTRFPFWEPINNRPHHQKSLPTLDRFTAEVNRHKTLHRLGIGTLAIEPDGRMATQISRSFVSSSCS